MSSVPPSPPVEPLSTHDSDHHGHHVDGHDDGAIAFEEGAHEDLKVRRGRVGHTPTLTRRQRTYKIKERSRQGATVYDLIRDGDWIETFQDEAAALAEEACWKAYDLELG